MRENEIGTVVRETAMALHRDLGPGLLETVYEVALADALARRGLAVRRQVPMPIRYGGRTFEEGFRADLIVEDKVLLELKSVEHVDDVHKKQLLTYLRLSGLKLGYLLNFGQALMKRGITRCVNGLCTADLALRASAPLRALRETLAARASEGRQSPDGERAAG